MGVTKLLRKAQKNKSRAHNRLDRIKDLMRKPEVKNVDIEAIKAEFAAADKQENKSVKAETAPKAEKTEATPKAEKEASAPEAEKSPEASREAKTDEDKSDSAE